MNPRPPPPVGSRDVWPLLLYVVQQPGWPLIGSVIDTSRHTAKKRGQMGNLQEFKEEYPDIYEYMVALIEARISGQEGDLIEEFKAACPELYEYSDNLIMNYLADRDADLDGDGFEDDFPDVYAALLCLLENRTWYFSGALDLVSAHYKKKREKILLENLLREPNDTSATLDPFRSLPVLHWVGKHAEAKHTDYFIENSLTTTGAGPFEEGSFDEFLKAQEIPVLQPGESTAILITGRGEWDDEVIRYLLTARRGKSLRVYTQEAALLYIFLGIDVHDYPDMLGRIGQDHPALKHLSAIGFDWQSTYVSERSTGKSTAAATPDLGVLRRMGYQVGIKGKLRSERREILTRVFEKNLPDDVGTPAYISQWGSPRSSQRLQKMANSIAAFVRNAKNKSYTNMHDAIIAWEGDLAWLKDKYYGDRFNFQWPSTSVD